MSVHANLTTTDLHEPKGAAGASANQHYVADGAASGAWTSIKNVITAVHRDLANATSAWVVSPYAGTITGIWSVIDGTADADTVVTAKIATVAVTNGAFTITASGSAAGDVDSTVPSGANTVTAGQAIEFLSDAAGTTMGDITISVEITRS